MLDLFAGLPQSILTDIVIIIVTATILAYLARTLRQPLIAAYVIAGIILGPIGLSLISDIETIKSVSEVGVILLLFIVGLQINISRLKNVGLVATLGGSIQVLATFLLGFFLMKLAGFDNTNAVYAGLIVAFSSTMIVVKLLSDMEELNSLHGRIMVGILLMQDLLVIIPLSILNLPEFSITPILMVLAKMLALVGIAYATKRFIMNKMFNYAAKSTELLFLLALTLCFFFSFIAYLLGFSVAIGAFIGGVTLASLPYYLNILGEIKPLKDFFATIFFVSLGMQLSTLKLGSAISPLIVLLLLTVFAKPLIILIILSSFGYSKRTSFVTALSLGQISEFALILIMQAKGIISEELFALTIITATVSITLTAYFMKYYEPLYKLFSMPLEIFEKLSKNKKDPIESKPRDHPEIVCFGCHRMGMIIVEALVKAKRRILVIDLNPDIIRKLNTKNIPCLYGDITNFEILKQISRKTKLIISTVPHEDENIVLLRYVKKLNPGIVVFLIANHLHEALNLYSKGADYVIVPHITGGEKVASLLSKTALDKKTIKDTRTKHLKTLLSLDSRHR